MSWRDRLRPASFRAVGFYVDAGTKIGGRRGVTFEFPKRDSPLDEDLGRRARRRGISGYLIGDDYDREADALEAACETEGAGLLIHPTMGPMRARCETYNRVETKAELRFCRFDMMFVEAPDGAYASLISAPTQSQVTEKADAAETTATTAAGGAPAAAEADWPNPLH
jgi:prophage DNA circulation protein